jgi:hypothetical protein
VVSIVKKAGNDHLFVKRRNCKKNIIYR